MNEAKQQALKVIDALPDDATWDDITYVFALRQTIERGQADSAAGRTISHDEFKKRFGITG